MKEKFEGMSRDAFLDGLVEKTGLNGKALWDKMVELLNEKPAAEAREVIKKLNEEIPDYYKGTKQGLLDWASQWLPKNEVDLLQRWKTSCEHSYFMERIAEKLGLTKFTWDNTAQGRNPKTGELIPIIVKHTTVLSLSDKRYHTTTTTILLNNT